MSNFAYHFDVSFGDCDPAGIVFYPNLFALADRSFHAFLKEQAGGHEALCKALDAKGLGVIKVDAGFRSPARDGDVITVEIAAIEWERKSFTLRYEMQIGDRLVCEISETRGIFVMKGSRLSTGETAPLQVALDN